jgi:Na+/H+-dicarboxylate symporter
LKIWIKMILAVTAGMVVGLLVPSVEGYAGDGLKSLAMIGVQALLYFTVLYSIVKSYLAFHRLRSKEKTRKIIGIFFMIIGISVLFSVIISLGLMNLDFFEYDTITSHNNTPIEPVTIYTLSTILDKTVSKNLFAVFTNTGNFIFPVLLVAFLFAIATWSTGKRGQYFLETIESLDAVMDTIIRQLLEFFPFAAFVIVAAMFNEDIFNQDHTYYILKPLLATGIVFVIVLTFYSIFFYTITKINIWKFYLGISGAALTALVTGNSNAVIIPLSEHLKKNCGIDTEISDSLTPLGAVFNRTGTVIVSTVVLMTIILGSTPSILGLKLQIALFGLLFLNAFKLDGTGETAFIALVSMILHFAPLQLEDTSYLIFMVTIPLFSRIATFIDTITTAIFIAVTAKVNDSITDKRYIEYI